MRILFAALLIGLVSANTSVQEIHSSPKKCYETCKTKYPMTDDKDKSCMACCTGCRFESIIGLVSVDNNVQRDGAQKACYQSCDEAQLGDNAAQCREGCDNQLKEAEEELANFDFDKQFSEMREMMNPIMNMFGSLLGGFDPFAGLGNQPEQKPLAIEEQSSEPVEPIEKEPETAGKSESETVTLEQILKDMGILVFDDKDRQVSVDTVPVNKMPKQSSFVLRDEKVEGGVDGDHVTYLRGLWRDRNTVQILLISSITACLFAILWMLCNSSNDPIVNRNNRNALNSEEPPSYNVLYGVDEKKKLPILVVAGVEEQAGPLPQKERDVVPLGFSTKI